jgi:DNA-binding GntR family transcriptional regulator
VRRLYVEHKSILDAVKDRDAERAVQEIRHHLADSGKRLDEE